MSNNLFKNMNENDEYYTDERAVIPILKYLKPNAVIWCPFDTKDSNFVKVLTKAGHTVIATHIWNNENFLEYEKPIECDYIISNPPYSIKNEIIEKLFNWNIKFALLIGVQALTTRKFMQLWRNQHLQLLMFENKIFFTQPTKPKNYSRGGTYFHTYYFVNGWLPKDLILEII